MAGIRTGALSILLLLSAPAWVAHAEDESESTRARYIGGKYEVHGTVTIQESGERRPIAGSVIFDQRDDGYTATYHLRTRVETEEGLRHADVVGRGEGVIDGNRLEGRVETQLILATVPGSFGAVPYMPRRFGPVLKQSSTGTIDEHGVLTIETAYEPVEGGPTNASVTLLRGERK